MAWNYRVLHKVNEIGLVYFAIHECFYDEKDDDIPNRCTLDPIAVAGGNVRWILEHMMRAVDKPVLAWRDGKFVEWGPVPMQWGPAP